jgi:hypothetical protein
LLYSGFELIQSRCFYELKIAHWKNWRLKEVAAMRPKEFRPILTKNDSSKKACPPPRDIPAMKMNYTMSSQLNFILPPAR